MTIAAMQLAAPVEASAGELHNRAWWQGVAETFGDFGCWYKGMEVRWTYAMCPPNLTSEAFEATVDDGYDAGAAWARAILGEAGSDQPDPPYEYEPITEPEHVALLSEGAEAAEEVAERLTVLLGHDVETCTGEADLDVAVLLYPADVRRLLTLAGAAL